jgi:hypothetical protein
VAQCVPCRGVQYPASLFFSAVLRLRADLPVHRVRRCVLANAGRCILRGSRLLERVRWAWVQRFRLREPRGRAAVPVGLHVVLVNAMFRAA